MQLIVCANLLLLESVLLLPQRHEVDGAVNIVAGKAKEILRKFCVGTSTKETMFLAERPSFD